MDCPPHGGFFIMIIWKQNRIIPESLRSIIFRRIEKEHNDKEKFYTSYNSSAFSDIIDPYYEEIIDEIMKDLGMFKRSTYYCNLWVQMYNSETDTHTAHSHFGGTEIISFTHIINCSEQKCFYFLGKDDRKIYPDQKNGDIMAWPSWFMQGIDKVEDPSINRLVVSGNIALKNYYDDDVSMVSNEHGNGHVTWDIL